MAMARSGSGRPARAVPAGPRRLAGLLLLWLLTALPFTSALMAPPSDAAAIDAATCNVDAINEVNNRLQPTLDDLLQTTFFRYFKVKLDRECPFWDEHMLCTQRDCSVEPAPDGEIPKAWDSGRGSEGQRAARQTSLVNRLSAVDFSLSNQALRAPDASCDDFGPHDYCLVESRGEREGVYVNLLKNVERYTGYQGPSAERVWNAIYDENCFHFLGTPETSPANPSLSTLAGATSDLSSACLEKRVFYRLVSGMHASISTHLCHQMLNTTSGEWYFDRACYASRVADFPERVTNIRFTYLLLLRAVEKIAPMLTRGTFVTGDMDDKPQVERLMRAVLDTTRQCPATFDERLMFVADARSGFQMAQAQATAAAAASTSAVTSTAAAAAANRLHPEPAVTPLPLSSNLAGLGGIGTLGGPSPHRQTLKEEFKAHFRNISQIMDCVGCEKCRLWGKLQVMGLGTALKILFEFQEEAPNGGGNAADPDAVPEHMALTRSEIVALFNTLGRFSSSLRVGHQYRQEMAKQAACDVATPNAQRAPLTPIERRYLPHVASPIRGASSSSSLSSDFSSSGSSGSSSSSSSSSSDDAFMSLSSPSSSGQDMLRMLAGMRDGRKKLGGGKPAPPRHHVTGLADLLPDEATARRALSLPTPRQEWRWRVGFAIVVIGLASLLQHVLKHALVPAAARRRDHRRPPRPERRVPAIGLRSASADRAAGVDEDEEDDDCSRSSESDSVSDEAVAMPDRRKTRRVAALPQPPRSSSLASSSRRSPSRRAAATKPRPDLSTR